MLDTGFMKNGSFPQMQI